MIAIFIRVYLCLFVVKNGNTAIGGVVTFLTFLVFIAVFPSKLRAIELRFPNGDVFQAELQYDDERALIVKYRGNDYKIPKKALDSYDLSKKSSPNTSYKVSTFNLKNGSSIRGLIAEERKDEYVVKSELGFLTLLKSELKPPLPSTETHPEFPEEYRSTDKENNQTKLGLSLTYLPLYAPLGRATPPLNGISFFVEPAFLKFGSFTQTGFRFEYMESNGPAREVKVQTGYAYLMYARAIYNNPLLDFYATLGGGASQIAYRVRDSSQYYSGTSPSAYLELGWQGLKLGASFYRLGIKNQCFFEQQKTHCGSGLEISGGWNF